MNFDFPIEKVEFEFNTVGDCKIDVTINGRIVPGNIIYGHLLEAHNILKIVFSKKDPADTESFATFKKLKVNGGDFLSAVKTLEYSVDNTKHKDTPDKIESNLYFGYIGSMEIVLEQTNDDLKKAAWTIADQDFQTVKWPLRGGMHRTKNFDTVCRDAKFMFTGCTSPFTQEISDTIDAIKIKDLRAPMLLPNDRSTIEEWIGNSKRLNVTGLKYFDNFVPANGVTDCLRNFIMQENIFMPKKTYYLNREMLGEKHSKIKDVFTETLTKDSRIMFEYPSPWYTNQELDSKIAEAKALGCYIALDLTWLPIANGHVNLDLTGISEVYVSMNKAWPIQDIRPAFRWSRHKDKDDLDLQMEYGLYTKINLQIFLKLLRKFPIDYVYNKYQKDAKEICKQFNLDETSVLWFTKRNDVSHNPDSLISEHYFLDDFVCIVHLLQHKGKYFW